jgi:hypothetical protein
MRNKCEKTDFYEYFTPLLLLLKLTLLQNVAFVVRNISSKSFLFFYVFGFCIKFCVFTNSCLLRQTGKEAEK